MAVEERIEQSPERAAQPSGTPDVRLEGVTKRFDDVVAVDDLSLEIERGSFFALLGPSGCGKTTTLRMIGGFEEPSAGAIYLGEREVSGTPPYKRDVNTVFQSYALFPHLSIFENVAFGLRRKGTRGGNLRGKVEEMLDLVQLSGYGKRKPRQLSGGQQHSSERPTSSTSARRLRSLPASSVSLTSWTEPFRQWTAFGSTTARRFACLPNRCAAEAAASR